MEILHTIVMDIVHDELADINLQLPKFYSFFVAFARSQFKHCCYFWTLFNVLQIYPN